MIPCVDMMSMKDAGIVMMICMDAVCSVPSCWFKWKLTNRCRWYANTSC